MPRQVVFSRMCVLHHLIRHGRTRDGMWRRKVWGASTQTPPNFRHDLEEAAWPRQGMSWPSDHRESSLDDFCAWWTNFRWSFWCAHDAFRVEGDTLDRRRISISTPSLMAFSPPPYLLPGWNQVCWYGVPPYRRISSSRGRCSWRVSTQRLS